MTLDGKLLRLAAQRRKEQRAEREAEFARRRREVYQKLPRVAELDAALRRTVSDAIACALKTGVDPVEELARIQTENLELQIERAECLVAAGYPMDYIDDTPECTLCGDTGRRNGKPCACLLALYRAAQRAELSSLLKLGEETFDSFRLDYYESAPDPKSGVSPRQNMELVYEACLHYARKFGPDASNLFLSGGTGLGKTFLSACIAKVVSEKGYSVVYDTASAVFARFEEEKFSRNQDTDEAREDIRRYFNCDLLILDDLGTEMTTSFVVSTLYTLLNNRLMSGKKTIISANYTLAALREKYSPQILSRLEGEYQTLAFYGKDIRLLKKNR